MPSFGDLVRDWQRGAQAVERGDWGCALRLFSGIADPPARMCFNVGCVHLLAGDPEAALRVSRGAPHWLQRPFPGGALITVRWVSERCDEDPAASKPRAPAFPRRSHLRLSRQT